MRRLIAYITTALTLLITIGVCFNPVFKTMNTSRQYGQSHEIVYKLNSWEEEGLVEDKSASTIADEFCNRLDQYNIDDYTVVSEGNDTIRVSLKCNEADYPYITSYLMWSGENFSMSTKEDDTWKEGIINAKDARLEYINLVPVVIIPVEDKESLNILIEACGTTQEGEGDEGEQAGQADIFLWGNYDKEVDSFERVQNDEDSADKLVASFSSKNIWYEDSEEKETEIAFYCGSTVEDENGNATYDTSKVADADRQANYLLNRLHASKYDYNVKVLYENLEMVPATVDTLLGFGTNKNVLFSYTLAGVLVATVVLALIFVIFYKLSALGAITNVLCTTFVSYLVMIALHSVFNIGALIGGVLVAIASTALTIYHLNKTKENIYLGRTVKKANQEANKKLLMPTIDVAVVLGFTGLMLYFIGGSAVHTMALVIFFGAISILLNNFVIYRLMSNLLYGETAINNNLGLINVDSKLVASATDENKVAYEGPYASKDFTKKHSLVGIISLAITALGAISLLAWGIAAESAINTEDLYKDSTKIYLTIELPEGDTLAIDTKSFFENNVVKQIIYENDTIKYSSIESGSNSHTDYQTKLTTNYYYYVLTLAEDYSENGNYKLPEINNKQLDDVTSLEDAILSISAEYCGESNITVESKVCHELNVQPRVGLVALATAISLVGVTLYFSLRYKASRALSTLIVSASAAMLTIALASITRVPVNNYISLALPVVAIVTTLMCIYYMNKEKEMIKEIRSSELTVETKKEITNKANSLAAGYTLIFAVAAVYAGINFFLFGGASFYTMFGLIVLGIAFGTLLALTNLSVLSNFFDKKFSALSEKLLKPSNKTRKEVKIQTKQKSGEPEETIYIGIND